jgi:hypothetical protein
MPFFDILFSAAAERFSEIGLPRNNPSCFLSSEQYAIPESIASFGLLGKKVFPLYINSPPLVLVDPAIAARISPVPLPN